MTASIRYCSIFYPVSRVCTSDIMLSRLISSLMTENSTEHTKLKHRLRLHVISSALTYFSLYSFLLFPRNACDSIVRRQDQFWLQKRRSPVRLLFLFPILVASSNPVSFLSFGRQFESCVFSQFWSPVRILPYTSSKGRQFESWFPNYVFYLDKLL